MRIVYRPRAMAYFVLLIWPLVALILFAALGRERGLMWTVAAGFLFLPEPIARIELPGLPDYFKTSAIALSVTLGFLVFRNRRSWPDEPPPDPSAKFDLHGVLLFVLLGMFMFGTAMTIFYNGNALVIADNVRQGLRPWDWVNTVVDSLLPVTGFFLAWLWLRSPRHHEELLKIAVVLGLIYSVGALIEMRLSPQFSVWVYGFFPHSFAQHVRGGDFRPLIFLRHGLWLAFFLLTAALAAFGMFRARTDPVAKAFYMCAGLFILAVLLLSPNLGAAMLAFLFVPMVLLTSRAMQVRVAMLAAILFLAFPAVRHTMPLDRFVDFVATISGDRAASLQFRLDNEDRLLERAFQKPLFGWGGWGRARVVDETGRDNTVADGFWVINLGVRGWVGYLSYIGMLVLPLLFLTYARRKKEMSAATSTLAMIGTANLVYLVPNSALSPIGWMMAGAVGGFVSWRGAAATDAEATVSEDASKPKTSSYTRFAHGTRETRDTPDRAAVSPYARTPSQRAVSD